MKSVDLTDQKYDHLTVLYPTEKRKRGYVVWRCRCDCGNEVEYSYNDLVYSNIISCGCVKKEHSRNLSQSLTHIFGTSVDAAASKKIPANNTTGCKGVYLIHGKYVAKIVFQKKQYYVGTFDTYTDAVRAREEAELSLFDTFCETYHRWQGREERSPGWCARNPLSVEVIKSENRLMLKVSPAV